MFAFALCFFVLLVSASLARPAERETTEKGRAAEQPLCALVRSAAGQPLSEAEAGTHPQEDESSGQANPEDLLLVHAENLSFAERSKLRADLKQFESSLVNWQFFEDLAPSQRALIRGILARCGAAGGSLAASFFAQFNASQRATFIGVTHAMLNTQLADGGDADQIENALQLVEEVLDVEGESTALPSDQQFQMIVRLTPDAFQKLERAARFEKGVNHVFHKDYPLSYRQFRRIGLRGREAGLHICLSRDKRLAKVHIDYRFGLLHLAPSNSDLRADGNHQRHVDRWPVFGFTIRSVHIRRIVLQ